MEYQLFTPGPTTIPPSVLQAMNRQPLYHKSDEFKQLFKRVQAGLQYVFHTREYVLPLSSSGTGAGEAVMMALHKAGDTVLVLNNGRFARRWCAMLIKLGVNVINAAIADTESFSSEYINSIDDFTNISAVWILHCETSTGSLNDIQNIIKSIRQKTDALICVDAVSTLGAQECRMDAWGIDALISCSQKGLMTPPGLGFVALSGRAWKVAEHNTSDSYYFDLIHARASLEKHLSAFTPAVGLLMGLDVALHLLRSEGMEHVFQRHAENAVIMRAGLQKLEFPLFPQHPSNSLTVIRTKRAQEIILGLKKKHGIIVAEGQDRLHGEIIRIGHMGYYTRQNVLDFLSAFQDVAEHP
jgi:aspartate aminotransferase-like enzyme